MPFLLDTDVVIHLRDANATIADRIAALADQIVICLVTQIELQAGLVAEPHLREQRRANMERIAGRFATVQLDMATVETYGATLQQIGYSRTRVLDRLIAATAIVHDLTLVTINGADFRDIPGLKLEVWPAPAQ